MDEAHEQKANGVFSYPFSVLGRRILFGFAGVVAFYLLITPFSRYILRAAWEETSILLRRQSIEMMARNPKLPPATLAKLNIVLAARAYADTALGLDAGSSFTTYSQLTTDTLVLVLSAAYQDRLAFHRWWFPIVGRVPYKGFFDFAVAERERSRLSALGFDTELRPASAFSTLGWLPDPLVSTTLRADSLHLANTVIHELTHNEFYASGQAEFNESFANFVGARGSAEFFRRRGATQAATEADFRWNDEKKLAEFWRRVHRDVDSVFKANPGDSAKPTRIALRDSVFREAKSYLVFKLAPSLHTVSPRYLERLRFDNATLLAQRIYQTDIELFDSVFVREGRDVRRTVERVIALAKSEPKRPYAAVRDWLSARKP